VNDSGLEHMLLQEKATWTGLAACRGMDPDIFYPESLTGPRRREAVRTAVATCRGCDVQAECLAFAMNAGEFDYGIWGGLDAVDRRRLVGRNERTRGGNGLKLRDLLGTHT